MVTGDAPATAEAVGRQVGVVGIDAHSDKDAIVSATGERGGGRGVQGA